MWKQIKNFYTNDFIKYINESKKYKKIKARDVAYVWHKEMPIQFNSLETLLIRGDYKYTIFLKIQK